MTSRSSWTASPPLARPPGPAGGAAPPLLLLDDILSEMDAARGRSVIEAVSAYDQLLITATDLERFPAGFLDRAAVFRVTVGAVSAAASQPIATGGTAES